MSSENNFNSKPIQVKNNYNFRVNYIQCLRCLKETKINMQNQVKSILPIFVSMGFD